MRFRGRVLGAALVTGAVLALAASTAFADNGTFSGSFTATSCGQFQPIQVAAGETTIDVVATADVPPTTSFSSCIAHRALCSPPPTAAQALRS
jgi:type 1 fimbria pilin